MNKVLFNDFFPKYVLTYISGREMDFHLHSDNDPFSPSQTDYLENILGINVQDVARIKQVHGKKIVIAQGRSSEVINADGLITDRRGLALAVRTADCLPVFLFDEATPAIGLVHAGWRGTKEQISAEAVKYMMKMYHSKPENIKIAFGPCIRTPRYEVGREFVQHFPKEVIKENQKYYFDLAKANKNQLLSLGILPRKILDCGICTFDDQNYHSFRRDGQAAGRILSVIMLKA